jgi:hypothetical protein
VKRLGFAIVSLLLSACVGPQLKVSCDERFREDSPAIEQRVLAAHPNVGIARVLACKATPTGTGFSWDPDEEACSVLIQPGNASYDPDPVRLGDAPIVVQLLAQDLPDLKSVLSDANGSKLFRTADPRLVILYAPHMRCIVIDEIT